MKKSIKKLVTRTYDEVFKERSLKLIKDILILLVLSFIMLKIEQKTKGTAIILFEQPYRIDILIFYILAFVFILTSSYLFIDLRNLMNIISRFVITRFPRTKGEFGPTKRIFRNIVHIILMVLFFYPVSSYLKKYSFQIFNLHIEVLYLVSLFFLILTMLFIYDILIQILRLLSSEYKKLGELLKLNKKEEIVIK